MGYESETPLRDVRHKVRNLRHDEDFKDIQKVFMRYRKVYFDPYFSTTLSHDKEWRRPSHICHRPMFIDGKPNRFDSLQGNLGDCWLISAMEAMTLNDELAKHVIPRDQGFGDNYCGAFHFRIWQLGVWYDVVIDDLLPVKTKNGALCYAYSRTGDVFWAALLEKAYAKVSSVTGVKANYESLERGVPLTGLQDLSGAIVERVSLSKPPSGISISLLLHQVYSRNNLTTCSIFYLKDDKLGLLPTHTYAITKLLKFPDNDPDYHGLFLMRIMNPWGHDEWRGWWNDKDHWRWKQIDRTIKEKLEFVDRKDGEFWMDERDFTKHYQNLWISHCEPSQYLECHKFSPKRNYSTLEVYGEWIKNYTAVGADLSSRHKNPQYMFLFEQPRYDSNKLQTYTTIIDLVHRSKAGRNVKLNVAFYVYSSSNMPLNINDMTKLLPLENPDFYASWGRAYVMSFSLQPGKYVIVPCTFHKNVESRFLLRVFSECHVKLVTKYDNKMAKSLPIEEEHKIERIATRMFIDSDRSDDGIDWIGLKTILDAALNQNSSYFGISIFFISYVQSILGISIFPRLRDKYDSDNVVFTKDECRSMIAMLDADHSGKLSISEFCCLWKKICFWSKVYDQHKDNKEGYIKLDQLKDALSAIGYDLTKRTVHSLSYVYTNEDGLICLTDFILCGVTLETVLSHVDKTNVEDKSQIKFTLEEWVKNTLIL